MAGHPGELLAALRKDKGLSQRELGGSSYSSRYVSEIEQGRARPSPQALAFFATALGVPLSRFQSSFLGQEPAFAKALSFAVMLARSGESEAAVELLTELSSRVSGKEDEALVLFRGAQIQESIGATQAALDMLHQALQLALDERSLLLAAKIHYQTGILFETHLYDYRACEQHYRFAQNLYKIHKLRNGTLYMYITYALGNALTKQCRYEEACEHYQAALAMASADNDLRTQASCHWGLGVCHTELGNCGRAQGHYESGLAIYRALREEPLYYALLNNRAHLMLLMECNERGVADLLEALTGLERVGSAKDQLSSLGGLLEAYGKQGKHELAWQYAQRALCLLDELHTHMDKAYVYQLVALTLRRMGRPRQALEYVELMEEEVMRLPGGCSKTVELRLCLTEIYLEMSQHEKAISLVADTRRAMASL